MSGPRYKWWWHVRRVLADYPRMKQADAEELDQQKQRELQAVEKALDEVDEISRRLVEMVFFKGSHTLDGAAQCLFISYRTARRRQKWVIVSVAENLGLAD